MQKNHFVLLSAAALLTLTSCSGKLGALSADNFTVTPNPLETQAGKVPATVNGTFPEKYMKKKAVVTVTPELRYADGQVAKGQSATFQGEKVQGNAQTILYQVGGRYNIKSSFDYLDCNKADMYLSFVARVGSKPVYIPAVKVANGIIATSELYKNTLKSAQAAISPDAFQRINAKKQEAAVKFLIQQAQLRQSELKNNSVQEFVKLLEQINNDREGLKLNDVEVSAYASPDGGFELNDRLAAQRQQATQQYVAQQLKKANLSGTAVDAKYTAEDWDGFQELVKASNIQDKDVILRVLSMYKDPEEREEQIRNMSEVFTDIKESILPELRRARLIVNYEVIGRSDEVILLQYNEDPSVLTVEELVYGANKLVKDDDTRRQWNETIARLYPSDYRALNNMAQMAIANGQTSMAQNYLKSAAAINKNAAEVNTNLALLALKDGDVAAAETYLAKGSGSENFKEVMGNLNIAKGNYTQAASDLAGINSNSAALAQILAKDYTSAKSTLAAIKNPDATTSYLQAILAARTGDAGNMATALANAIKLDPTLATRAANDIEFVKYESTVKSLLK